MFECKYPLLEVIQAIEKIREAKGPTEIEVLDYVRKHVRKPDDPVKVLKTITTLKKLVEEGVLVQRGKRYMFSPNPPGSSEEEDDDDGDDDDDDDDINMDAEDCEEDCDEDDDDDDDDDDEEEDDDDDSSEECDDKEILPEGDNSRDLPEGAEDNTIKTISKNKNFLSPSKTSQNVSNKISNTSEDLPKCVKAGQEKKKKSGKSMIKGTKANTVIDQKSGDGKTKGGEAIAFCTRDFIDSQYRPQSESSCQIQPSKSEEIPQDSISPRSEKLAFGSMFSRSKKNSRMKRSHMSESNYRSRSPIREMKPEMFGSMRLDHPDEIGSISSQLFQEQGDAEMEVDGGKDGEIAGTDFDMYRHRSPVGPPPTNTSGVHVNREESFCSNFDAKNQNEIKLEPNFEEYSLKKNIQAQMPQMKCKENPSKRSGEVEKRPDKLKRGLSSEDEKNLSDDARASLCSICEKKKRNS